jgi:HAD superfamily hydrolase (TIGR01509 family)
VAKGSSSHVSQGRAQGPALIFDLDGTLVDSVYDHVAAWHEALRKQKIEVAQWRIHRAIGMSGKMFLPKLLRELEHRQTPALIERLEDAHAALFSRAISRIALLPGSLELLRLLERLEVPFAVATSGSKSHTDRLLARFRGRPQCPVITADDVAAAKPAPDLFVLAAQSLRKDPSDCFVVGDSVWDILAGRRMKGAAVGLLSGGFDKTELQDAGAYRVYEDTWELSESLEQLGMSR